MSGITDPSEEFFKDGLWAWVTNQWKKLVADASNFLQVNIAAQDVDVEVKQTAAADLTPGIMGWDGSAWRKLPLLWGYSGHYIEVEVADNVSEGSTTLTFSTVPSGEIWRIENYQAWSLQATATRVVFKCYDGSALKVVATLAYPTAGLTVGPAISFVVPPNGYLSVDFEGCATNDDIRATAFGYKMKIGE